MLRLYALMSFLMCDICEGYKEAYRGKIWSKSIEIKRNKMEVV